MNCNLPITDTVLIFGRSPFIREIDIQSLLSLGFTTFGVNQQDFKTDYSAFVDDYNASFHESCSGTIITQSRHKVREPYIYYDNFSYDFTHDYLLKWLHGRCGEAILIGAADFDGYDHYNAEYKFTYHPDCLPRSKKFIEGIRDFKIYKMNPRGILNVPMKSL